MEPREAQALDAAKLYYGLGCSQDEVSRALGVSRPTVSKLIQLAKDRGYVEIRIRDPRESASELADRLRERFGLDEVRLATGPAQGDLLTEAIGRLAARLIEENVHDGDLIGLSWGRTLYAVAQQLVPTARRGVQIVELKGGIPLHSRRTLEYETMTYFCEAFDAYPRALVVPVLFEHAETRRAVEAESHVQAVLELGRQAGTAIFTVGGTSPDSTLFGSEHLLASDREFLLKHAAGDIFSRFYDDAGRECLPSLAERTIALSLEELRVKERRICVAAGRSKVRALHTALEAGFVSHLVTDEATAELVLSAPGRATGLPSR